MKQNLILSIFTLLFFVTAFSHADEKVCYQKKIDISDISIEFLNVADSKKVLESEDEFLKAMTPLDFSLRLLTPKTVTKSDYLNFLVKQVKCWNENEINKIESSLKNIFARLNQLGINNLFPRGLKFIKTNGLDEGGAYHTRLNSTVVPKGTISEEVLAHELFHIFTNEHPEKIDSIYELIGFKPINNSFQIPSRLTDNKITNPDAPNINHYIEIIYDGKEIKVVPIIRSSVNIKEIDPKAAGFFKYIDFSYFSVPEFKSIDITKTNFFTIVGQNTGYLIHPEEILAGNFSLLVSGENPFKSPQTINNLKEYLQNLQNL